MSLPKGSDVIGEKADGTDLTILDFANIIQGCIEKRFGKKRAKDTKVAIGFIKEDN